MTNRAVMQQALEALCDIIPANANRSKINRIQHIAIAALREALAQPEQEPSQWREMVVVTLVREGINKHKARELADHFAAQPERPKPVAWGVFEGNLHDMFFSQSEAKEMAALKGTHAEVRPLYAAAAQRPWVGLTPEEVQFYALKHRQLVNAHYDAASDTNIITAAFEATVFYETVEQALKERNG